MGAKVQDLMASGVLVVKRDDTVGEVKNLMKAHDVHALPVVDENDHPVGIVTAGDLLADSVPSMTVSRIMTPMLHSVRRQTGARQAAHLMREHGIHHLVVVEEDRVVGILSSLDLLRLIES